MGKEPPFKSRQSNLQLIIKGTEAFYRVSLRSISAAFPLTRGEINVSQTVALRARPGALRETPGSRKTPADMGREVFLYKKCLGCWNTGFQGGSGYRREQCAFVQQQVFNRNNPDYFVRLYKNILLYLIQQHL